MYTEEYHGLILVSWIHNHSRREPMKCNMHHRVPLIERIIYTYGISMNSMKKKSGKNNHSKPSLMKNLVVCAVFLIDMIIQQKNLSNVNIITCFLPLHKICTYVFLGRKSTRNRWRIITLIMFSEKSHGFCIVS